MRTLLAILLYCVATASAIAAEAPKVDSDARETVATLGELSQRSGLPEVDLNSLLADCSANQQSMYFCAWRDQIAADRALRRVLADKEQKMPKCKPSLESKIVTWGQRRDLSCDMSEKKQWGEGSMRPTAKAICIATETTRMTKRLENMRGCNLR